jgi:hypothetical protein
MQKGKVRCKLRTCLLLAGNLPNLKLTFSPRLKHQHFCSHYNCYTELGGRFIFPPSSYKILYYGFWRSGPNPSSLLKYQEWNSIPKGNYCGNPASVFPCSIDTLKRAQNFNRSDRERKKYNIHFSETARIRSEVWTWVKSRRDPLWDHVLGDSRGNMRIVLSILITSERLSGGLLWSFEGRKNLI